VTTAFQLELSAHAPWTRTMLGYGPVLVAVAVRAEASWLIGSNSPTTARTTARRDAPSK
jgi:hypothetical protein